MGTARGAGASTAADAAGAGTASASAGADTAGGKLSGPSNSSKSKASPISMSELRKLDKALLADLRRLGIRDLVQVPPQGDRHFGPLHQWQRTGSISLAVLRHKDGRIMRVCRTQRAQKRT